MSTSEQKQFRPRTASILSATALTITVIAGTAAAPDDLGRGTPGPAYPKTPNEVSELELPVTVSHRGGSDVYPEESMEGFTASAKDGFLPEMDIQFLEDGTPVLIRDDTADRTLNGVSGPIRGLSLEEWDSATIKHPNGGPEAETVTLDEALDELGGKVVMVPEIKPGATSAEIDQVLDVFDERGLTDSLIVQSFDFEAAKTIAQRGYTSLYLTGAALPTESFDEIADAGIEWVGPSKNLSNRDLHQLDKAGFHVAPYTLETAKDGHRLPGWIDGYFTDDAWTN